MTCCQCCEIISNGLRAYVCYDVICINYTNNAIIISHYILPFVVHKLISHILIHVAYMYLDMMTSQNRKKITLVTTL